MKKILVVHGPNLQLLGEREVSVYGKVTLKQINEALEKEAAALGVTLEILQSNHEGAIVDRIGTSAKEFSGIARFRKNFFTALDFFTQLGCSLGNLLRFSTLT